MAVNFGSVKRDVIKQLDDSIKVIDSLLIKREDVITIAPPNSLVDSMKKLEQLIPEDKENIAKTEQSFVDLVGNIVSSLKGIKGIVEAVKTMANAGCPAIPYTSQADYATEEYIKLSSVKLWSKFRDNISFAQLVDINGNRYIKGSNAIFKVAIVNSADLQEPSYRIDFNIEPYMDDNKTVYLYLGDGFIVTDPDGKKLIQGVDYTIKNIRTVDPSNGMDISDCIYVYKNDADVMCAKLMFDIYYPSSDNEDIGYPKDYFYVTVEFGYNESSKKYSLRVIDDIPSAP